MSHVFRFELTTDRARFIPGTLLTTSLRPWTAQPKQSGYNLIINIINIAAGGVRNDPELLGLEFAEVELTLINSHLRSGGVRNGSLSPNAVRLRR